MASGTRNGREDRGIADILDIAVRTVVFHKCNVMDKLGLRTTAELTRYAFQSGLVAPEEPVFDHPAAPARRAMHA